MMRALIEELIKRGTMKANIADKHALWVRLDTAVALVRKMLTPRPVTDSEPAPGRRVLIYDGYFGRKDWRVGMRSSRTGDWIPQSHVADNGEPTHWLPLPDPPGGCAETTGKEPDDG